MRISKDYFSPHFEDLIIPVEFLVIHYTAQSLKESLSIFLSPKSQVSCHLLIDRDGSVYELVDCWDGKAKKAFHAGESLWQDREGKKWTGFNKFSLGIELVNWNGNIFHFSKEQYESLSTVLSHLKNLFPQLNNPDRLLGHEHIAGFRGKKDPGYFFDWSYLFKTVYEDSSQNIPLPVRESVLTKKQIEALKFLKDSKLKNDKTAKKASLILENKHYPFWLKRTLLFFLIEIRNLVKPYSLRK